MLSLVHIGEILVGGTLVAAVGAALLARALPATTPSASPDAHRLSALTGFRGLLAFGVFMHHSFIWGRYSHGRGWLDADGFHQFGESRVILFFMLTATLFYGRLIDSRGRKLDWLKLYVSRILRLGPAYWVAMSLMFAVIAYATVNHIDGAGTSIFHFGWDEILQQCFAWMGFSLLGMPAIDGYFATPVVTAVVTWTLPYEITFYVLLPLLALPLRVFMPATTLALGLAGTIWLAALAPEPMKCLPFVGGMAVALVVRVPQIAKALRHGAFSIASMAAMTSVIFLFPTAFAPLPMLLLAFSMAVVASDNDFFGVLRWRAPQALGNWAYSLYLLHGIALYTLLMLVIGADRAAQLSSLEYAGLIAAFVPVVLALAWASHRWIESPPMRAVPAVVSALRGAVARLRAPFGRAATASPASKA